VMCMPWLASLHWLDPAWTGDVLLARMRLTRSERSEAVSLWRAYLYRPRMPWALLDALKGDFLALFGIGAEVGDEAFGRACHVFADIVIARAAAFSGAETRAALAAMGPEGGRSVLDRFGGRLRHSDDPRGLWGAILGPWLEAHWPTSARFRDALILNEAAELLLESREAFREVFATLDGRGLVGEAERPGFLLYRLSRAGQAGEGAEEPAYDYVAQHPREVCRWLTSTLPARLGSSHDRERLGALLSRVPAPSQGTPERGCWEQLWERSGRTPGQG
jgi:hypothetical protein